MSDSRPLSKTALIVFHGIGEQKQYETLNTVANSLDASASTHANVYPGLGAGDTRLISYATLGDGDDAVDLFEAYWSPWTKGKVSLSQVTRFLFEAGSSGLWTYFRNGKKFDRYLFGRTTKFSIPLTTPLTLGTIFGFLMASLAVAAGYVWVGTGYSLMLAGLRIFDQCLLRDLRTWIYLSTIVAFAIIAGFLILSKVPTTKSGSNVKGVLLYVFVFCFMVLQIVTAVSLALCVKSHWQGHEDRPSPVCSPTHCEEPIDLRLEGILEATNLKTYVYPIGHDFSFGWGAVTSLSLVLTVCYLIIPKLLTTFLGDLVAYLVASHASEFYSLREEIRRRCYKLCRDVMSRNTGNGYQYENIIFVGHSLGSVIAYDTLNRILAEDSEKSGFDPERTRIRAFLTLGSPLNKAAFLFGESQDRVEVRTSLMACLQPMISSSLLRASVPWINVWSWFDPVSAALTYYDPEPDFPTGVINILDDEASVPVIAHITYWQHARFKKILKTLCRPGITAAQIRDEAALIASSK